MQYYSTEEDAKAAENFYQVRPMHNSTWPRDDLTFDRTRIHRNSPFLSLKASRLFVLVLNTSRYVMSTEHSESLDLTRHF